MNTGRLQPQMIQKNADVFLKFFICAHLRNLWLNNSPARETDNALKEILEKIGV